VDLLYRNGIEIEPAHAPVLLGHNETALFQYGQVLHHGDSADIEPAGKRADANPGVIFDLVEHAPAAGVGKRLKYSIHVVFV
jgi:hypothetical protein